MTQVTKALETAGKGEETKKGTDGKTKARRRRKKPRDDEGGAGSG